MIREYYALAKPGLIFGNIITIFGGFAVAAHGNINFETLLAAIVGLSLVMGSGCTFNNIIDRDIDGSMERTKDRALVKGSISLAGASIFGTVLGIAGFVTLLLHTNLLTFEVAIAGFFFYVVAYSLWAKRRTLHGALVGSVSGAVPPVVGYCAASGRFDGGAIILFFIMVFWQMAHFYAIAIYRGEEYSAAGIPTMPAKRGVRKTKTAILLYIIAFTITAPLLSVFGYSGRFYMIIAVLAGLFWLSLWLKGLEGETNDAVWARKMFLRSLVVMMGIFLAMSVDSFLRM